MLGSVGHLSLAIALVFLALLSRRLGRVTHAPPYYIGLLFASGIMMFVAIIRLFHAVSGTDLDAWSGWPLVYHGLPALGISIAVSFAWRYWSWLLAERD